MFNPPGKTLNHIVIGWVSKARLASHPLTAISPSTLELDYKTLKDMPANQVWQLGHLQCYADNVMKTMFAPCVVYCSVVARCQVT